MTQEAKGAPAINASIVEAVNRANESVMGQARAESQAVTYESLAHSIALIMHNAGAAQFGAKQIEAAVVAKACQNIMSAAL